MRFVVALLACVACAAYAQTPAPAPAPESPQPPAAERAPLKLRLDNPSSWATDRRADDKDQPGGLPTLGDNARPMPKSLPSTPGGTSPYPSEPKAGY